MRVDEGGKEGSPGNEGWEWVERLREERIIKQVRRSGCGRKGGEV